MPAAGYHRTVGANWRNTKGLAGNFVGVEIETHNERGLEATVALVDNLEPFKGNKSICEYDGSICHYRGIEVITPPIPLAAAVKKDGYLNKLVATLLLAGVTVNPEKNYGLHINLNVADWTDQDKQLLTMGIHMLKDVCQKLGGRTGEAKERVGYWDPAVEFVRGEGGFKVFHANKYNPAWVRNEVPHVLEIRYPKAVVDYEKIKANISFAYSVRAFNETEAGRWAAFFCAHIFANMRNQFYQKAHDLYKEAYLAWLAGRPNFKKLYAAIGMKAVNIKPYTLAEITEYAKANVIPDNPIIQKQAVEWGNHAAQNNPVAKAA